MRNLDSTVGIVALAAAGAAVVALLICLILMIRLRRLRADQKLVLGDASQAPAPCVLELAPPQGA